MRLLVSNWRWCCVAFLTAVFGAADTTSAQTLTLIWDPSSDPSVIGYIVYAGTQSGEYTSTFDVGNATMFNYGVLPEQPYYFAVAAYADGSLVGRPSEEVVGTAHMTVLLMNPGDQTAILGQPAELQLVAVDSFGGAVPLSVQGLPPGLEFDASTGRVSGIPIMAGAYYVTVIASDGVATATQAFTWTTIAPALDVTPPTVTITMPSSFDQPVYTTYMTIGGVAFDDVGVSSVRWSNSRGGIGYATGTDTWLAGVLLHELWNEITITATDTAGNRSKTTVFVYRQP